MPEITKTEDSRPQTVPQYVWILLAILTIFVYFFGLTLPFLGPDEARYAQVGREMLERGDWVTPTLGGFNWFEKPALLYWLEIVSYKVFGVNEFAARLGPALFGLGTIASLWILGRNLATENTEKSVNVNGSQATSEISVPSVAKTFANYLALIAASTIGILVFSRGASFDIIITFPITAALAIFFIWHLRNELRNSSPPAGGGVAAALADEVVGTSRRARVSASLFFFYFFIGIALLAKGLIGIVFPFAIVGFFYVLSRRLPSRTFLLSLVWGTLLAAVIAAIWYLPMYERHGYAFIDEFIIQQHFQRFTSNKYQHPQPFYFFLWVLPLMTLPWLPFFFASTWLSIKKVIQRKDAKTPSQEKTLTVSPSRRLTVFSISWLLIPLVFFSFSGSKLPGYILPSVPAAIILTAVFVYKLVESSKKWRNAVLLLGSSTLIVVVLLLIFAVPRFAESDSVKTLIQTANESGYSTNRVMSLYTISHNAEFYAAGRLVRDNEGKQLRLYTANEILAEINAGGGRPVLVLVPLEHLTLLTRDEKLKTEVLKDNGELAITVVSAK